MSTLTSSARGSRNESGAVLVEFSLVIVLFVALLYGLIAFGMALALKQSMTNAASEAARAAVGVDTNAATREDTAEDVVRERLSWLGDRGTDPTITAVNPHQHACGSGGGNCMTVEITYDYENHPLVPALALPGFGYLFPDSISTSATVQMPD